MIKEPRKLNHEVIERIRKAVSEGLPLSLASKSAGVSFQALQKWLKQARDPNNDCELIAQLGKAVDDARYTFQENCVKKIQSFSDEKQDSSGYKFLLERSPQSRKDWAQKSEAEIRSKFFFKFLKYVEDNYPQQYETVLELLQGFDEKLYDGEN